MPDNKQDALDAGKRKVILVVDDEPGMVAMVGDYLTLRGYRVFTAYDGVEGLTAAKKVKPDMIILDIMMPRMDGYEMLERLKKDKDTVSIPVIMLSAKTEDKDKLKAAKLCSEIYITKPVELNDLGKKIETVFNIVGGGS